MSKLVTLAIKTQAATLTTATLDGKEYTVVPATIIVAGVLNSELVPADELAFNPGGWNGRPIPLRHPKVNGEFVSANDPNVIEGQVLGQFFNAEFDGDRVKGEMWLDTEKINRLGGDALKVLQRIQSGEIVEVSTGYFAAYTETSGEYNGETYSAVQNSIIPDHIALLPDEVGACSIADGCGCNRVNADQTMQGDQQMQDHCDSVMIAFYLRAQDAAGLALPPDALPDGSVLAASELHVTLAYLGDCDDVAAEFNRIAVQLADMTEYAPLVLANTCGYGRFACPESGQDAVFYLVESEPLHQFRDWLCDCLCWDVEISRRHGFIPHITLGYVPTGSEVTLPPITPYSLVFDQVALSWGAQAIVFDLNGTLRDTSPDAMTVNSSCSCSKESLMDEKKQATVVKKATGAKANEGDAPTETVVEQTPVAPVIPAELTELAAALVEFGGAKALLDAVRGIKANADREHTALVAKLATNAKCTFAVDELKAMTLENLQKIQRMLVPADYSGQAGLPLVANTEGDEWEAYTPAKEAK